jgi:hypothetical protein
MVWKYELDSSGSGEERVTDPSEDVKVLSGSIKWDVFLD